MSDDIEDAAPDAGSRKGFSQTGRNPMFWPLLIAAAANDVSASFLKSCADVWTGNAAPAPPAAEPLWTSPNRVLLELPSMQLRDFSTGEHGCATLVCAPFALHRANIADFAEGHSILEALRKSGLARLFLTDWRSATSSMCNLSIDSYLADLNVAIDEIGTPVNLIGLCQGGWMALLFAARFPEKVRRLVLAGAPVDIAAGESYLSRLAADAPLTAFESLVDLGKGRVLGRHALNAWGSALSVTDLNCVLQIEKGTEEVRLDELKRRFEQWNAQTVDLPGIYYLEVVNWLFKENRIAQGGFVALGRTIDLGKVEAPIYVLAARDDELIHPEQALSVLQLVRTPKELCGTAVEACSHLGLFLGRHCMGVAWPRIARWLAEDRAAPALA
jgi:poly(3-hydroxyalkanoate) synthetase